METGQLSNRLISELCDAAEYIQKHAAGLIGDVDDTYVSADGIEIVISNLDPNKVTTVETTVRRMVV